MPIISVIVPVYNTEKYLCRCIDSILSQSFIDFELLLINDGSTDLSGTICDEYAMRDMRVRVFHTENKGSSAARNQGIECVRGEWITFVDSDDYVRKDFLNNFVSRLNDNVDLICQGMEFDHIYSEAYPIKKCGVDFSGNVKNGILELYKTPMPGSLCNKCFKSKIVLEHKLRLNESFVLKEDEVFVLNYLRYCKDIVSAKNPGYYYFIPQWERKYKDVNNRYEIAKEIYNAQLVVCEYKWNVVLLNSILELTQQFTNEFLKRRNKRGILLDYKKCVGENILKTKMFAISKWLIYVDRTGYFSTGLLIIHLMLKHIVGRVVVR